jgi:transcriptional regulator with XRE-family HTH domain
MPPISRIQVTEVGLAGTVAALVRHARITIGWSQATLAERMHVSQAKVWRLETAQVGSLDLHSIDRAFDALGLRAVLEVEARHLADRGEQRDVVHARLVGAIAERLRRAGWLVETEVRTGARGPTGWIDVLAYRAADGALLVIEVKTQLLDAGALLRQISFYEREASFAAGRLGWRPAVVRGVVLGLDSVEVAEAIDRNRELLAPAFPGAVPGLSTWLVTPGSPPPAGRTLALVDLARRRGPGLLRSPLGGRRSQAAYRDYAAAAELIRRRRT